MVAPTIRYATTLAAGVTATDTTLVLASTSVEGKDPGGAAKSSVLVVTTGRLRLSAQNPANPAQWFSEVVLLGGPASITYNGNGTITCTGVSRNMGPGGTDTKGTGIYSQGTVALGATFTANAGIGAPPGYAFGAGSVVENLNADAQLVDAPTGFASDLDDAAFDLRAGNIRFLNTVANGAVIAGNKNVTTGMMLSVHMAYQTASKKRVSIGRKVPVLPFTVELEHRFQDGRLFYFRAPNAIVKPSNSKLDFQPTDWIGSELSIDTLLSSDPADVAAPYGYAEIDNDPITLQPVATQPESYSAGVYNLFLTPNVTARALAQGLPTTRFSIGNVRTGGIDNPQEFLEHYVGIPQIEDAVIRLKQKLSFTTTIENLTAENIALLFNGNVSDISLGVMPTNRLLTVSDIASLAGTGYTLKDVAHPVSFIMINPILVT